MSQLSPDVRRFVGTDTTASRELGGGSGDQFRRAAGVSTGETIEMEVAGVGRTARSGRAPGTGTRSPPWSSRTAASCRCTATACSARCRTPRTRCRRRCWRRGSAWTGFEGRSSVRTWLYRIATNRCLNLLRSSARRPVPRRRCPYPRRSRPGSGRCRGCSRIPDVLLEGLPDRAPGPEARYESREAISLAFVTAVQLLPPNQRAVLLLRDVLGYRASETAELLGLTEDAVTSALKRARATMDAAAPAAAAAATRRPAGARAARPLRRGLHRRWTSTRSSR